MKKIALMLLLNIPAALYAQKPAIIPQPVSMQYGTGDFIIDNNTTLKFNKADMALQEAAVFFKSFIKTASHKIYTTA